VFNFIDLLSGVSLEVTLLHRLNEMLPSQWLVFGLRKPFILKDASLPIPLLFGQERLCLDMS